jgi:ABC-2 type transport system permease protein
MVNDRSRKICAVVRKEWAEVFKNRLVLFTVLFLPLLLTALPLISMFAMQQAGDLEGFSSAELPPTLNEFCAGLSPQNCGEYFFARQFMLLFLLLPLAIPVTIAAYSIVGEKTTRTLEPVLATPIQTLELLAGKGLAATIPAVGATWFGFIIFSIGVYFLSSSDEVVRRLLDPIWLIAVLLLGPLLSLAAVNVAVIISSWATDPRTAEQLSMLVALPLLLLFVGQIMGWILIDERVILWMVAAMVIINIGLLYVAANLFQRETILTRWR